MNTASPPSSSVTQLDLVQMSRDLPSSADPSSFVGCYLTRRGGPPMRLTPPSTALPSVLSPVRRTPLAPPVSRRSRTGLTRTARGCSSASVFRLPRYFSHSSGPLRGPSGSGSVSASVVRMVIGTGTERDRGRPLPSPPPPPLPSRSRPSLPSRS